MSSRECFTKPRERKIAAKIYRILLEAKAQFSDPLYSH